MNDRQTMLLIMAQHHEDKDELDRAREFREKILETDPSSENHRELARILRKQNRLDECELHLSESLRLDPDNVLATYAMAVVDRIRGRYDLAMERYLKLKRLGVDDPKIDSSMGVLHSEKGEYEEALRNYETAYEKDPEDQLVKFNLSLCLLTLGDYERGLPLYESRKWHCKPPGKEWKGEPTDNLLVVPEQGNGDIIHFSRFLPLLRPLAKKITVLCNRPLVEIMRTAEGQDEVLEFNPGDEFVEVHESDDESVGFAHYVRIMSIPHTLGLDPREVPFNQNLRSDPQKVRKWAQKIQNNKFRVGLCWQGGRRNNPEMDAVDNRRSVNPDLLLPLLENDNVEFYSLQKERKKTLPGVQDLMDDVEDFTDTAALMENLDLIITVDTAVAHMAATLGRPTWTLCRMGGCWRWGTQGETTHWYPDMTLFRQNKMDDWEEVIKRVAAKLSNIPQQRGDRLQS